jgi:hypothetical protein
MVLFLVTSVGMMSYAVFGQSGDLTILSSNQYIDSIDFLHVVGEVQNNSPSALEFVQVIGTFYDSSGQVVGTSFTYTTPSTLNPSARAPFHILLSDASIPVSQIANYSLQASHS